MSYYQDNRDAVRRAARNRRIASGRQPRVRLCRECQAPATSSRHQLCDRCRARSVERHRRSAAERRHPMSTTARGYGARHMQLRRRWAPVVKAGGVACGRCGHLIAPGTAWDLSHPGDDKSADPVPWHQRCNRQYAATVTKKRRTR